MVVFTSEFGCVEGAVAQRLEQATHNRLVAGSIPAGPIWFSVAPPPKRGQRDGCENRFDSQRHPKSRKTSQVCRDHPGVETMAGLGRPLNLWLPTVLCAGWIAACGAPVSAQVGFQFQQRTQTPEEHLLQRLPREPYLLAELNHARELLQAEDYEAAIDTLQPLLVEGEDVFEVEKGLPTGSSLNRVESLLRGMPPEAIDTYRRRYEPEAAQRLAGALARVDLGGLLAIIRTYPLTLAAAEASQVAAEFAFDQGETALAARLWERLLISTEAGTQRTALLIRICQAWTLSGQPESAAEHLLELSTLAQDSPLEYEGKLLAPPATADAAWLSKIFGSVSPLVPHRSGDWRMMGGHPRRWGSGALASPLQRGSWAYPLIDQFDAFQTSKKEVVFQAFLKDLEKKYQSHSSIESAKTAPLVIGAPLVVGDTVLVQGYGSVKALDARTGAVRWSGVVRDDTFLYLTWRNVSEEKNIHAVNDKLLEVYLGQRAWLNQAGAALSSDGRQVYAVSGTGMVGVYMRNFFPRNGGQPPPHELTPPSDNRLLAYDISTGLLKWESGGPSVAVQLDNNGEQTAESRKLGGAFFLGAPLPVDGQLFTLAEDHGQIRLFSLSPETGEAEWSLPLLNPDIGIAYDETRRMYGLSPAYAGGLLICPTGEGVVVAVDPLQRRVEWIQQYQQRAPVMDTRALALMRFQRQRIGNESQLLNLIRQRRWIDSTPILTANRVLLPAAESNQLHCFDVESGKLLWELPRGEGLFIATCTERYCLIVGERSMKAIQLKDGKSDSKGAWSREIPMPTGRGVVSGEQYLLPVATNEILAIDIKTGRLVARSGMAPAHRAGSLVTARGQLLMQTTSEVVGLRSLSEASTGIARDLNDPALRAQALADQGELLLFQGREAEAVTLLQESLQLQESLPTRRLLVWSLLERLKSDYAGSRALVAELKKSVTDPDQKKLLNRLNAEGLEKSGELVAAFREYLDLIPEIGHGDTMIEVAFDHQVREDRWLRARLTHMAALANSAQLQQMQTAIREAFAAQDAAIKPHFANVIGIDLAPQLHLELALSNRLDQFMAPRVLWTLSESVNPQLRGPAVARLIRNELSQQRTTFVKPLLAELEFGLASVECEPGVTGQQLLERFRKDQQFGPLLEQLAQPLVMPQFATNSAGGSLQQREIFPMLGARRGPFADWLFAIESNLGQTVLFCDGSGKTRHPLNLDILGEGSQSPIRYVQTDPQLVLLAFRDRFAVISPMDIRGNQFETRFQGALTDLPNSRDRLQRAPDIKPGVRDVIYPTADNSYLGNVGPLTYDTLCYLSGEDLFAVSPHVKERKVLWRRSGVSAGSEICADSEYVILIPPLLDKLIVLRAADGTQMAERALPKGRVDRQRADWGRLFLVQRDVPGEGADPATMTWAMYDPVTDRDAWSMTLPAGTKWAPVEGSALAMLEPNGTLRLVDDQSGIVRWVTAIPAETVPPDEFSVQVDVDRLYVHTAHKRTENQDLITEYLSPANGSARRVNGQVVALDRRRGQVLWSRPMEQQLLRPYLPVGSGVLAYAAQKKPANPEQTPEKKDQSYTALTFLNRSTGEPVLTKDVPFKGAGSGEGWARPTHEVMLMRVSGQDFRLTWKGEAGAPPMAPEQDEPVPEDAEEPIKLQ